MAKHVLNIAPRNPNFCTKRQVGYTSKITLPGYITRGRGGGGGGIVSDVIGGGTGKGEGMLFIINESG